MRLFSIAQWHHFAYMIISLALLGFGASGTVIALFQKRLMRYFQGAFTCCGIIYACSTVLCFQLSQRVPFNPFMILWDKQQYLYLLLNYLILFIPFFFGASCIGLGLMRFKAHINRLYFADLFGAGVGALSVVLTMYFVAPANNLLVVSGLGFLSIFVANLPLNPESRKTAALAFWRTGIVAVLALFFIGYFINHGIKLHISQYKGLSGVLNFPDAHIEETKFSPLGLLQVVRSKSIRYAPGLSLTYEGVLPRQLALFNDADSMSAITEIGETPFQLDYIDYASSSLPYYLVKNPKVLILGAGGGADVLAALYYDARAIDAVELNPQVVELVEDKYGEYSGHIYRNSEFGNVPPLKRHPPLKKGGRGDLGGFRNSELKNKSAGLSAEGVSKPEFRKVRVVVAEARGFIRSTDERYDLIQVALLDSFSASAAGVYTLSESYLYTVEAMQEFLRHLNPGGMLAITRWLKLPPRDALKVCATVVEALEKMGVEDPSKHLVITRDWKTGTILVKNTQFIAPEIAAVNKFCAERSFDVVYYPGITESEANQYNLLEQPEYFRGVQNILFGDRRQFYEDYAFNIKPATDNQPYFFHFFKWRSMPMFWEMIWHNRRSELEHWIPFAEWGYIILIATLIQAIIVGIVLILAPLFVLKAREVNVYPPPDDIPAKKNRFFRIKCGNGIVKRLLHHFVPRNDKKEAVIASEAKQSRSLAKCFSTLKSEEPKVNNQAAQVKNQWRIFVYFLALGLGFMFIEMAFIQKFILLLSYPTYAIAVVLCAFLIFAGCGSLFSRRIRFRRMKPVSIAVCGIIFVSALYLLCLDSLFHLFLAYADVVKIPIAITLIAPLAFFMGIPFPLGLQKISDTIPTLIPWAWGINGCASVISSVLATCLAISLGFTMVILIASVLYTIAAMVYR